MYSIEEIILFSHPCHKNKLFDVCALICQFKKAFREEKWQGKKKMCFSTQSKTPASHNKLGGEREGEQGWWQQRHFFFQISSLPPFLSFTFFLYFQTLFISCACFPFAATKQHQAIFKHGCLLKWNLTSHQPLQKRSVKLYKRHRNKISNTIQLFCIRTCT